MGERGKGAEKMEENVRRERREGEEDKGGGREAHEGGKQVRIGTAAAAGSGRRRLERQPTVAATRY